MSAASTAPMQQLSNKQANTIAYKIMRKVRMEAEAGNTEAMRFLKEALSQ